LAATAPTATRRAGLFGGSFDPVHRAHVALANAALKELQLDEVRWVPAGQAWQKSRTLTDATHREAMLRLALEGEPRFVLDRIEIERAGPSYTLDTVQALQAAHPDTQWFLLIGQDQYAGLHTWHGWQQLLGLVVLAVANRPGDLRAIHPDVTRHPHRVVPLPMLDISATDVRARAAQGEDLTPLVPPAVARYIKSHGLYQPAPRS
jgi:nicotinate-nucleotide adenylyltransferase